MGGSRSPRRQTWPERPMVSSVVSVDIPRPPPAGTEPGAVFGTHEGERADRQGANRSAGELEAKRILAGGRP